jgi:hypothetical protein
MEFGDLPGGEKLVVEFCAVGKGNVGIAGSMV